MRSFAIAILTGFVLSMVFTGDPLYAADKTSAGVSDPTLAVEPVKQQPKTNGSTHKLSPAQKKGGKKKLSPATPVVTPSSGQQAPAPNAGMGGFNPGMTPTPDLGIDAVPGAGGGSGAPPRGAAEAIRDHAAANSRAPRMTSFSGYSTCVDSGSSATNTLTIRGTRFGNSQGTRRIAVVVPIRHTIVRGDLQVLRWSDNEITVRLPYPGGDYQAPRSYQLAMFDQNGRLLGNYSSSFEVCRIQHQVSGDISLQNCSAGLSDMIIIAEGDYPVGRHTTRPVSSEHTDFGYSYHFSDLPAGNYMVSIEMRDARRCRGGYWIPSRHRVSLGHRTGSAVADFNYAVEMDIVPIPISLVRRLLNDMLQGTAININNYPTDFVSYDTGSPVLRAADLWYGDSRIRLPEAAGGYQAQFNMPVFSRDPFTYYVNHIDLERLDVIATSTGLKIRLTFETNGDELIKECHDNFFCAFAGNINMDLVVNVDFTLVRHTLPGAGSVTSMKFKDLLS